jgi:hypothetical protein
MVVVNDYQIRPNLGHKEGQSSKQHGFALLSHDREFVLATDTAEEKQSWIAYLQGVLDKVQGIPPPRHASCGLNGRRRPWLG